MGAPPKAPPVYKPVPPRLAAPPVYRPNQVSAPSAQLKPANSFRLETRPAPPVYRPQLGGSTATAKVKPPISVPPTPLVPKHSVCTSIAIVQKPAPAIPLRSGNRNVLSPSGFRPIDAVARRTGIAAPAARMLFKNPNSPIQLAQEETAEEQHEKMLKENRAHFRATGRPLYRTLTNKYPNELDELKWLRLTNIHGRARNRKKRAKKAGNQNPGSIHLIVKELLDNFVSFGFGYRLMEGMSTQLLDKEFSKGAANGNCLAYAKAFADIVNSFGIAAEVKEVRGEEAGRFIVKLASFIDPSVPGHIYEDNVLKARYYMFTSHYATWVDATQRYYDPMATISYSSLAPYIECELDSNDGDGIYTPKGQPKTLCPSYDWQLVRTDTQEAGGFRRLDLVEV